jgi:PAS domain S-box-containing protein
MMPAPARKKITEATRERSERDRRNTRLRFESLVESIDGIVWELALPGSELTFVSKQAERILGYPLEQWLEDPSFWQDHVHPDDRGLAMHVRSRTVASGEDHQVEYRMIASDGRIVWFRDMVTAETSEDQRTRLHGVMVDVTERKKEEVFHQGHRRVLELIAADAPLRDTLKEIVEFIEPQSDGLLCSILLLDGDGMRVRHGAAPSLPEGYTRAIDGAPIGPKAGSCGTAMYRGEQVIVTDILEDPLWEDYRALASMFGLRACWSTPILARERSVLGTFAMYYHEPRSPRADELRLTAAATHLAGIAIERHRAERALRQSEERYRRIVDTAYEGIWMIDETDTIVFVNQRMAEMLGYSVDEMVGRSARDFAESESSEEPNEQRRRPRPDVTEQFDFRFRRKDGAELWGIVSTTPVWKDGGVFGGSLGMVTDITLRKHAEQELLRNSEEIRDLAGRLITAQEEERRRISRELHDDIVQKVASLAIRISMVKKRVPASADFIVNEIANLQGRVSDLAEDIRQLSHQLHPVVLEHLDLTTALQSFTAEFSRLEGVQINLTAPEHSEAIPKNVALCAYRVVQESLRNVAKHSGAKAAEVELSIVGNDLHLSVRDEGRGFEVEAARSRGLGMVSVEERVRLCQGSVQITSKLSRGTTLTARIPLNS